MRLLRRSDNKQSSSTLSSTTTTATATTSNTSVSSKQDHQQGQKQNGKSVPKKIQHAIIKWFQLEEEEKEEVDPRVQLLERKRGYITQYMERLSSAKPQKPGSEYSLNEDGIRKLVCKDIMVTIQVPDYDCMRVYFYAILYTIPTSNNKNINQTTSIDDDTIKYRIYDLVMELNGQNMASKNLSIALRHRNEITLCFSVLIHTVSFPAYERLFKTFMSTAIRVQKQIQYHISKQEK